MRFLLLIAGLCLLGGGCGSSAASQEFNASEECQELSEKLGIKVSKQECDAFERQFNSEQPERDIKSQKLSLAIKGLGDYELDKAVTCKVAASLVSVPLLGHGSKAAGENANNVSLFWEMAAMNKAPGVTWAKLTEGNKLYSYINANGEGFIMGKQEAILEGDDRNFTLNCGPQHSAEPIDEKVEKA